MRIELVNFGKMFLKKLKIQSHYLLGFKETRKTISLISCLCNCCKKYIQRLGDISFFLFNWANLNKLWIPDLRIYLTLYVTFYLTIEVYKYLNSFCPDIMNSIFKVRQSISNLKVRPYLHLKIPKQESLV